MKKIILKASIAFFAVVLILTANFLDRNILDAIYLDSLDGGLLFNNVKTVEHIDYNRWMFFIDSGTISISYDKKYIRDGYRVGLHYNETQPNILEINAQISLGRDRLYLRAEYDYKSKILTWKPLQILVPSTENKNLNYKAIGKNQEVTPYLKEIGITKSYTEEAQNYILKDVVLKSWAKGNLRFPFNLLRGVRVRDCSWDFPE